MENFEKCTVAMLGGPCSQHVMGNTSWLNQPQSAIIRCMPVFSFNGGRYNLQLIKPYLAAIYRAKAPVWLSIFQNHGQTHCLLIVDSFEVHDENNADEMGIILKRGACFMALSTNNLALLDACNYSPAHGFYCIKYLDLHQLTMAPPAGVENPFHPTNTQKIWPGCATPYHPTWCFVLLSAWCQHPGRGPGPGSGMTELCRALVALSTWGHDLASRPTGALQRLWCSAIPDGPAETVRQLQGGGAGYAERWTIPAKHRHVLQHARLCGPVPHIQPKSGRPG